MKRLYAILLGFLLSGNILGMQDLVIAQKIMLEYVMKEYPHQKVSPQVVDRFLAENYPANVVSVQEVYSNQQEIATLCGLYAMQNMLWGAQVLALGRQKLLASNKKFADLINAQDITSKLNGMEMGAVDEILNESFKENIFPIFTSVQQELIEGEEPKKEYRITNISLLGVVEEETAAEYLQTHIAKKSPIVSFLIICNGDGSYGVQAVDADRMGDGAGTAHWVVVTMLQSSNGAQRVYWIADSRLTDSRSHYDEVVGFIKSVERSLPADQQKKVEIVLKETAAQYQIPENSKRDDRLRAEWFGILPVNDSCPILIDAIRKKMAANPYTYTGSYDANGNETKIDNQQIVNSIISHLEQLLDRKPVNISLADLIKEVKQEVCDNQTSFLMFYPSEIQRYFAQALNDLQIKDQQSIQARNDLKDRLQKEFLNSEFKILTAGADAERLTKGMIVNVLQGMIEEQELTQDALIEQLEGNALDNIYAHITTTYPQQVELAKEGLKKLIVGLIKGERINYDALEKVPFEIPEEDFQLPPAEPVVVPRMDAPVLQDPLAAAPRVLQVDGQQGVRLTESILGGTYPGQFGLSMFRPQLFPQRMRPAAVQDAEPQDQQENIADDDYDGVD